MNWKKFTIEAINIAFVALWGYAAFSKLLVFETFRSQLGQSPLLKTTAGFVAIALPVAEILLALMLIFDRTKRAGIIASFTLMSVFTLYLIGMLTFSKDIPCSCGGILQEMTWTQHIYFNIGFVILALVGTILHNRKFSTWLAGRDARRLAH